MVFFNTKVVNQSPYNKKAVMQKRHYKGLFRSKWNYFSPSSASQVSFTFPLIKLKSCVGGILSLQSNVGTLPRWSYGKNQHSIVKAFFPSQYILFE